MFTITSLFMFTFTINVQASSMYSRATSGLLSKSMMLHFAYADFEEQLNKNEKVHEIYKQYLAIEGIDPTLVRTIFYP